MEEMLRYVAETQPMMGDNIVQLSEIQSRQQTDIERHSHEMEKLTKRQSETDRRLNIFIDEVRFLNRLDNVPEQTLT